MPVVDLFSRQNGFQIIDLFGDRKQLKPEGQWKIRDNQSRARPQRTPRVRPTVSPAFSRGLQKAVWPKVFHHSFVQHAKYTHTRTRDKRYSRWSRSEVKIYYDFYFHFLQMHAYLKYILLKKKKSFIFIELLQSIQFWSTTSGLFV